MKPCITNDTPLVGGARSAPVGTLNGVTCSAVTSKLSTNPRGNSLAGTTEFVLADEVAIRDELAGRVEPGLEVVVGRRPVLVVGHVVFARPQQLDRNARQPRRGPLVGDDLGDAGDLDVVVAHQPASESAAGPDQMHRDVLRRNAGAQRRMLQAGDLARRPDLEAAVVVVRRRVLRLERRVRQEREVVLGLDDLGRGLERGLDVADAAPPPCGGGRRRRAADASPPCPCTARCSRRCSAVAVGPSSQMTFSVRRASFASHQLSATIATPDARELLPWPAGSTRNACLTPGSFLTSSRLALTALPPNTGHFSKTA